MENPHLNFDSFAVWARYSFFALKGKKRAHKPLKLIFGQLTPIYILLIQDWPKNCG